MKRIVKWVKGLVFVAVVTTAVCVPSIVKAQDNGQTPQSSQSQEVPQAETSRVAIVGAVANPGTFAYNGNLMLKDVFAAVGGFTKDADRDNITVTRGMLIDPSKAQKIKYDYDKVMKGQAADIPLMPGDVVEVPERRGKRNVLGQIASGLKRLPSALIENTAGRVLPVPLLSKAIQGVGSLLGIGDKDKTANAPMPGTMGSPQMGSNVSVNRQPTALEAALIQAITAESPEVRDRILSRVLAVLQPQTNGK